MLKVFEDGEILKEGRNRKAICVRIGEDLVCLLITCPGYASVTNNSKISVVDSNKYKFLLMAYCSLEQFPVLVFYQMGKRNKCSYQNYYQLANSYLHLSFSYCGMSHIS